MSTQSTNTTPKTIKAARPAAEQACLEFPGPPDGPRREQQAGPVGPPLKWHGGKNYLAAKIISLMLPHLHYVEPYFGGGQVLFARDRGDRSLWWTGPTSDGRKADGVSELVNDRHANLMNFYAVLRDPTLFDGLQRRLQLTLFSEAEWGAAGELLRGNGGDPVERAAALFISVRQSRAAQRKGFVTPVRTRLRGGRQDHVNGWWNAVDGLHDAHRRLRDVLVLCRDALDVIRSEDTEATLFYLDPPYLHETRTSTSVYAHEMTRADHEELLHAVLRVKGKVILSGYPHPLYDDALAGWHVEDTDLANHAAAGGSKGRETERLWLNYTPAT